MFLFYHYVNKIKNYSTITSALYMLTFYYRWDGVSQLTINSLNSMCVLLLTIKIIMRREPLHFYEPLYVSHKHDCIPSSFSLPLFLLSSSLLCSPSLTLFVLSFTDQSSEDLSLSCLSHSRCFGSVSLSIRTFSIPFVKDGCVVLVCLVTPEVTQHLLEYISHVHILIKVLSVHIISYCYLQTPFACLFVLERDPSFFCSL